ncbi:sensor histidine kinase [Flavivirga spongiicola]|uniref:Histidine kinase n=1 Tax=Flavivirga spongiicola TaxID=421621 RepID=A0ABU7XLU7_9FLAO|nr:sensor histidine kinase [Flavivirga sp. MEBiC05379]MDO5981384.1 histidine kinase [Flavivirga sp. MEBiC05379]
MKLLLKLKKHQYTWTISLMSIGLFFIVYTALTNKIETVTEELISEIVKSDLIAKQNVIALEFERLDTYLIEASKILNSNKELSPQEYFEKLELVADIAATNVHINKSWAFSGLAESVSITYFDTINAHYNIRIKSYVEGQIKNRFSENGSPIFHINDNVYLRKTTHISLPNGRFVGFSYDIDLLKFWEYYSQKYVPGGSYTVLTTKEGICILHPEVKYIGREIDFFFKGVDRSAILDNINVQNSDNLIKTQLISEYLGLEVLRFYKALNNVDQVLILGESFPVDIKLKESMESTQRYFTWISVSVLGTFILVLVLSRLQLTSDYNKNLKVTKEREQLRASNEKFQRKNAVLQLQQLKKKMNPHFLFNSLNSLHVLIESNPDLSQEFVLKLANVYRYVLAENEGNLAWVKNELEFMEQYFFLQQIRFKGSLFMELKGLDNVRALQKKIPLLSLQTLLENAIKHNSFTKNKPLQISIEIQDEQLIVSNNYNPRKKYEEKSHKIGLKYIKNSYEYYGVSTFYTEINNNNFSCYLPLLP